MSEKIFQYLRVTKGLPKQDAMNLANKFGGHDDIIAELENYIDTGKYRIEGTAPVEVDGYTALRIKTEFKFEGFDCFDILLHLRISPKEIRELMDQGFPMYD